MIVRQIFDINDIDCVFNSGILIYNLIKNIEKKYNDIVFICIGTPKIIGDSLAPKLGDKLYEKYNVYGTILDPIHAKNIEEKLSQIDLDNNLIIAIDANCGQDNHSIVIKNENISPGKGLDKKLPTVGDISILGNVTKGCNKTDLNWSNLLNVTERTIDNYIDIIYESIEFAMFLLNNNKIETVA